MHIDRVKVPEQFRRLEGSPYVYRLYNVNPLSPRFGFRYWGLTKGEKGWQYNHSSKCPLLNEDVANGDIKKVILYVDKSMKKVKAYEGRLLELSNAGSNPRVYNKSKGINAPKLDRLKLAVNIAKEILETQSTHGILSEIITIPKVNNKIVPEHYLQNMIQWQVRDIRLDDDHVNQMVDRWESYGGDIDAIERDYPNQKYIIVILVDRLQEDGSTKDTSIGGTHTTEMVRKAPSCRKMRVLRIPREIHEKWSDTFVTKIACELNPWKDEIVKTRSYDDVIKELVNVYADNINDDPDSWQDDWLRNFNWTFKQKAKAKSDAKRKFNATEKTKDMRKKGWLDPNGDIVQKDIAKKKAEAEKDPTVYATDFSMKTDLRHVLTRRAWDKGKKSVHIIVKIANESELNKWNSVTQEHFEWVRDNQMKPLGKDLTFELAQYMMNDR